MNNYKLTIGWIYPQHMSTYGDHGNIIVLQKRCEWRGIKTEVKNLNLGFDKKELTDCDILFMGGAQDKQQEIVAQDLSKKSKELKIIIENGTPGLYICGAYQFLGNYYKILGKQSSSKNFSSSAYKDADGTKIKGLGIFDLHTENPGEEKPRLIGNIIADSKFGKLIGFENHGGRTYLGKNIEPLGKVIKGFGNNAGDKTEGAVFKESFGTYLHGPILPKNPKLADYLITKALEKKYNKKITLSKLDDSLEIKARSVIAKRLQISL